MVKRFLDDVKDGHYDHYADLAVADYQLENPAMRGPGLEENGMGLLVARVDSTGPVPDCSSPTTCSSKSTASRSPATALSNSMASA